MIHRTPGQMLIEVNQLLERHRVPGCKPVHLIIRNGHLFVVDHYAAPHNEIEVMYFSKRMLIDGLSGAQWDALQRKLIRLRKEIDD